MSDQTDADKIRNKRLAKLGAQSSQSSPPPQQPTQPGESSSNAATPRPEADSSSSTTDTTSKKPHINISSSTPPKQTSRSAASDKQPEGRPRIKINQGSQSNTSLRKDGEKPAPAASRSVARAPESAEAFEERTLSVVFRITLDENQTTDVNGAKLKYLPGVRQELEESGDPVRISVQILDQALLEAASGVQDGKPFDYLLPCWKRVSRLFKGFKKPDNHDSKYDIVKEARRLCMSYCMFSVTMPDMFGFETLRSSPLKDRLLLDPDDERGLCHDFLTEAVRHADDDESIISAFVTAVEEMSAELSKTTMSANYKPYVIALRRLAQFPPLVIAMTESRLFNYKAGADTFEAVTLLGPWFQLSPLQKDTTLSYFSSPKTRDQNFILDSQRVIRMTQQMLSTDLLDIVKQFIRASKSARERTLDWFAAAVNLNHKRRAMQVDQRLVSSDGFMFNITTCLDQLCEPFMDATFSKVDRIDANYLKRNPRVHVRDETKINADQETSDAFYEQTVEGESNFISEVFFLAVAAHHYGSESLNSRFGQLDKDLRRMEKEIDQMELERHKWVSNPAQLKMFEEALKKYKDRYDIGLAYKYSLQGMMADDMWQTRSMQLMRYVIVWMLRLVSGRNFPKEKIQVPLPEEQPEIFKCLPEYFLDDIVSNFNFIMTNMPHIVTSTQGDEIIILCITFLRSSEYIKNPYLKAGLISVLFRGTWPRRTGARGVLVDLLNSMPFATENLLHTLMQFYIEVEFTGTHTQFFDKFNIRFEIFQIIKCIWSNPIYREKLAIEASKNVDFFVRFVNLLLNDVTFVLDESFTAFLTIHDTQLELSQGGSTMDENTRQEKEEQLAAAQHRAKSFMQLTNETVAMLKLFTEALADSFTMPEIVQRLADMLDYNLDAMVGPKSTNLKVDNAAEYGFNPRALLSELIDVYLNLMDKQNFITAVARDGRSYKPANFEKAADILRKRALKSSDDLKKWAKLQKRFKAAKEADEQAEEDLGEIPDEFLDPLVYTLMEDPVILPNSRITIDRSTISAHLLSDPNDPFNRVPLKLEDVIPDTEMKAKIDAFKAAKKAEKQAQRNAAPSDAMDTTPG